MSTKSFQDMSARERKSHSLTVRSTRSMLVQSVIFGLAALVVGLGLHGYTTVNRYIAQAFSISRSAAGMLEASEEIGSLKQDIMAAYYAQDEAQKEQVLTEEYEARFEPFTQREDYAKVYSVLNNYAESFGLNAVYIANFDLDNSAMVYIMDWGDTDDTLTPGDWENVSEEGIQKFLAWEADKPVYQLANTEDYGFICTSGTPIFDNEGQINGFVFVDLSLSDFVRSILWFTIGYVILLAIATVLIGVLSARRIDRTMVKPITTIAEAAQEYTGKRQSGAMVTDCFKRLDIHTGDEIENLKLVMADMEESINDYLENLTRVTAEKERIGAELSLATNIQASMLPHIFPAFPTRSEFDIYASMDPAKEVGGDFYDYFLIDEDHLCMVIADVSGKGVPAALFMMASKIILQSVAMMGYSPAEILRRANNTICSNNEAEMFVTVWLGILEISTGKLTAANAGHEFPALREPSGAFELYKDKHGFVIGGMEGVRYKEYEIQLHPGSKLFVYTDGVAEATSAEKELYGTERMIDALNVDPDAAPQQILRNVRSSVDGFVKDAEQFDDLTMLCVEYKGGGAR